MGRRIGLLAVLGILLLGAPGCSLIARFHGSDDQAPVSCAEILARDPSAPDGSYTIRLGGEDLEVHCDMTGGGWTRVVRFDIDASDTDKTCPGEWKLDQLDQFLFVCVNPKTGCESGASASAFFESPLGTYGEVRGFVRAYQNASTDAFNTGLDNAYIDRYYVDGISITYGAKPRTHLWTLAAGLGLGMGPNSGACPCANGRKPPSFAAETYYCDTANLTDKPVYTWFTDHVLWAGGTDAKCDPLTAPAWFEAKLEEPTAEPIEVRLLQNQCDENLGVIEMELYVK